MNPGRTSGVANPALKKQILELKEGQRSLRQRIKTLEARLAGLERDLAIDRARLLGRFHVEPHYVRERLGLTPGQSRVAVALAEGGTVRSIAQATGRTENTIRYYLKEIYRRLDISSQTELVRLVLLLPYGTVTTDGPGATTPGGRDRNPAS